MYGIRNAAGRQAGRHPTGCVNDGDGRTGRREGDRIRPLGPKGGVCCMSHENARRMIRWATCVLLRRAVGNGGGVG